MPNQPTSPHLAPTSPRRRGRPQKSTSPLAPLPYGGEVELAPNWRPRQSTQVAPTTGATSGDPR